VLNIQSISTLFHAALLSIVLVVFPFSGLQAGGGMVIEGDKCIVWIDFYSAHFTAYQPANQGNKQFCQQLPGTGPTIFVLDYLHKSLKDVPVSFRIIHDVTGQGSYVKLKHVEKIDDLERHSVYYQPPVMRADASLKIEHNFTAEGKYIGIVTAGHPNDDTIYTAVFPFEVGGFRYAQWWPVLVLLAAGSFFLLRRFSMKKKMTDHPMANP